MIGHLVAAKRRREQRDGLDELFKRQRRRVQGVLMQRMQRVEAARRASTTDDWHADKAIGVTLGYCGKNYRPDPGDK